MTPLDLDLDENQNQNLLNVIIDIVLCHMSYCINRIIYLIPT